MHENIESVDRRAFRNMAPTAIWTVVWLATLALARFGPDGLWPSQPVLSWIAVIANAFVGIGVIVVHARYLRRIDDLQRKILLDAMAIALGVGLLAAFTYAVANAAELITFDANIAVFAALMGVTYGIVSVVGTLRYR